MGILDRIFVKFGLLIVTVEQMAMFLQFKLMMTIKLALSSYIMYFHQNSFLRMMRRIQKVQKCLVEIRLQ